MDKLFGKKKTVEQQIREQEGVKSVLLINLKFPNVEEFYENVV